MTEPHPDDEPKQRASSGFFHGRRLAPLIGPWAGCIIAAILVYIFERQMPAFHDVVKPVYFVIAVVFVIATGRALRSREGARRGADRRHADRRHGNSPD